MRAVVLLVLSAVTGAAALAAQEPQAAFRAQTDSVRVDVSVLDRGQPVAGLTARDFEVFDNGTVQEIADLSQETLPVDLTVALDASDSVSGAVLTQLRRSVQQLRADLHAHDRLKLLTFNMRVQRVFDFDAPAAAADAALARVEARGSTSVYDTIAVALTAPPAAGRRQLVVVFTDGEDSTSISDINVLRDLARRSTLTLDVVLADAAGPATRVSADAANARREFYAALTRETGGVVERVQSGDNLSARFRRLFMEFRQSYVLHYIPRGVERAGVHTLDIRVKRQGLTVRARQTYVWR